MSDVSQTIEKDVGDKDDFFDRWMRRQALFRKRVNLWYEGVKKRGEVVDRRENAAKFAIDILGADSKTADKFIYREIRWDIIKGYGSKGKFVECKVCGQQGRGSYWCSPCIHHDWCCECCILLGYPGYGGGMFSIGRYKCSKCGEEFTGLDGESHTELGVGMVLAKRAEPSCPKCGKADVSPNGASKR